MSLVTPYGRYSRAAVVERAKEIKATTGQPWGEALAAAYKEASIELREFYRPRVRSSEEAA